MTARVRFIEQSEILDVLRRSPVGEIPGAERTMYDCLRLSKVIWAGEIDGKVVCAFGVIQPQILFDQAYLWLLHTDAVEQHKFVFIRNSQVVVEALLEHYNPLVGYADIKNHKGIRWLKWLGAEFGKPEGLRIPFVIRRK